MDNKEQKDPKEQKDLKIFLERAGAVLIMFCVLGLMGAFGMGCYLFINHNVQDVNVRIEMPVDSTGVLKEESIQKVAELKEELIRHEQLLDDRYKHVLEQKENMNDLLTIGGMFLTIILSLFGFFGYKTMATLEEKVKQEADLIAESTAKDTAREASKSRFDDFAQSTTESLEKKMQKNVSENVNMEVVKTAKKILDASSKEIKEEFSIKIDEINDNLSGITKSLENLDQLLSKLNDRVNSLEISNIQPSQGRRSLKKGGNK